MTHSIPQHWLIFQNWTGPSAAVCGLHICFGTQEVHDPPVLLALGGELVVKRGGAAVDAVGRGGAAILAQRAVWQVQHGAPLEGLQAGRGNEAGDGHWLFTELQEGRRRSVLNMWLFLVLVNETSSFFPLTHVSFLLEVFLNAHSDSLQSRLPFLRGLVQLGLQLLDVLQQREQSGTMVNVTHDTGTNQSCGRKLLQRGVWWWRRAGRGSRCCNTATRSSSYCWRWCPAPPSSPTSPPSSSSRSTAPWTESRPWRSPICSGWGCWSKASGSPATQRLEWVCVVNRQQKHNINIILNSVTLKTERLLNYHKTTELRWEQTPETELYLLSLIGDFISSTLDSLLNDKKLQKSWEIHVPLSRVKGGKSPRCSGCRSAQANHRKCFIFFTHHRVQTFIITNYSVWQRTKHFSSLVCYTLEKLLHC